jgi:hypothetical protein
LAASEVYAQAQIWHIGAKLAPRRKVGTYAQSWHLGAKLAPRRKVGTQAQSWHLGAYFLFKKLPSGGFVQWQRFLLIG